jgi:hypothetical protein
MKATVQERIGHGFCDNNYIGMLAEPLLGTAGIRTPPG